MVKSVLYLEILESAHDTKPKMGVQFDEDANPKTENIPLPVVVFSSQQPVVQQPAAASEITPNAWMSRPEPIPDCPPGLEYLAALDELHIDHQSSHEHNYSIANKNKEKIFQARLESSSKYFVGMQNFYVKVFDNCDKEIINVDHKFGCSSCFCCCFLQKIHAVSSLGSNLGVFQQEWNMLYPTFAVKNSCDQIVFRIEGPFCQMECCTDTDFKIITPDGKQEVGKISSKSSKSHIRLCFPSDMDVGVKAIILSACFLIDLIYFKTTPTLLSKSGVQAI
ncbi:hypothetical protein FQR65_LT15034 [Abscondita terminalis]|nr:hypothetical protein FQR65_LT15034 [Abscondita terminalis]